jgi:MFS family permease
MGRAGLNTVVFCYFVASFAALGLPPYLSQILPTLGDTQSRWAGALYVVPTLFSAIGAPIWGRLADRFGSKPLLLRAQIGLAVAFLLAGLANNIALFALALVAQGFLGGNFAASNSYLAASLDKNGLAWGLTLMQGAARASLILAPLTVGALSAWISPHQQYLVMTILPLGAALALALLPAPTATATATSQRMPTVGRHPRWMLFTLEMCFQFATVITFPYFIALTQQRIPDISSVQSGTLFALPHVCYLVFAKTVHRRATGHALASIGVGLALVATSSLGQLLVHDAGVFVALRLVCGLGMTAGLVGLSHLAADSSTGHDAGRTFGSLEFFSKIGAVAAGLAATAACAQFSLSAPFALSLAVSACAALLSLVGMYLYRTRARTTTTSALSQGNPLEWSEV